MLATTRPKSPGPKPVSYTHLTLAAEVLEWDGALAGLWLPTENPLGSLVKLRRTEGEIFRQVNSDGKLGKHYVFKADSEGNIVGMKFNNNVIWKTAH